MAHGALTADDLLAIWRGAADKGYTEPLEAAGEGNGFEAWTQMFQQFARASRAIDVTTQALYILPGSGQTNPPAPRANFATVALTVTRTKALVQWATALVTGQVLVDEVATDWGENPGEGARPVRTGRRYVLLSTLVLPPGDPGPYVVEARAERPGYGYNNPLPGSLTAIDQPGDAYANVEASVAVALTPAGVGGNLNRVVLTAANVPDMFLPSQVGQYVELTAGSNAGAIARVVGYVAPDPAHAHGSGVLLALEQSMKVASIAGAYQPGEVLLFKSGGTLVATGLLLEVLPATGGGFVVTYELQTGPAPAIGNTLTGQQSGATSTITMVMQAVAFVAETGTASWRVLDWADDLGVRVTNPLSPEGGTSAMLDELGYERGIPAGTNEPADVYRQRVARVADTVAPNAIRRATAKALGALPWCFREVGDKVFLPGMYFDVDPTPTSVNPLGADYYDTNCLLMTGSFAVALAGTFGLVAGSKVVSTTVDQTAAIFAGQWVVFASSPGLPFQVASVSSTQIVLKFPWVNATIAADTAVFQLWAPHTPLLWEDASGAFLARLDYLGQYKGTVTSVFAVRGFRALARTTAVTGDQLVTVRPSIGQHGFVTTASQPATVDARREHLWLDYLRMRAYFQIGVPPIDLGEFGFYYDTFPLSHLGGFYDEKLTGRNFYDGYAAGARRLWRVLWQDIERIRAGGTTWEIYEERVGCP